MTENELAIITGKVTYNLLKEKWMIGGTFHPKEKAGRKKFVIVFFASVAKIDKKTAEEVVTTLFDRYGWPE